MFATKVLAVADLHKLYQRLEDYYDHLLDSILSPVDDVLEVHDELAQLGLELGLPGHGRCDRCGSYILPHEQSHPCGSCEDIAESVECFLRYIKWPPDGEPPPQPCGHGVPPGQHCVDCERDPKMILYGMQKRPVK